MRRLVTGMILIAIFITAILYYAATQAMFKAGVGSSTRPNTEQSP